MRTRAQNLDMLRRLRSQGAPLWVIKSQQVASLLNRRGLKHHGLGMKASKAQGELYERFVIPHMG